MTTQYLSYPGPDFSPQDVKTSGAFYAGAGGYRFSIDNATGIQLGSSNALHLWGNGTYQMRLNGTSISFPAGQILLIPDGSAAAPSLATATAQTSGLYTYAANSLGFATNGLTAGHIDASQNWTMVGSVTAASFAGPLTGNVTGNCSGTAASFTGNLTGDVTSTGMATTLASSIAGTHSFSGQLIGKGTATNDSASAGYIGEYMESTSQSGTAPASGQYADCGSLTLTAGDWDVTYNVLIYRNTATFTSTTFQVGLGTVTGNDATGIIPGVNSAQLVDVVPLTFTNVSLVVPHVRVSLSGTTTYYGKVFEGAYTGSIGVVKYKLSARRVR